jgi:uncharacterized protein (DUF4213/DUF364 family)
MFSILEFAKDKIRTIITEHELLGEVVSVHANPLTPEEAIGQPDRRDFPIIEGKERVIESVIFNSKGHAFTDSPVSFHGTVENVLALSLETNQERAIFFATVNAIMQYLNLIEGTVHCRDNDPEGCGAELASHIMDKWGIVRVGLIGYNPAIAENLIKTFGPDHVLISDLNEENINTRKFGVYVENGNKMNNKLILDTDVICISGTTIVNDSFDDIWECIRRHRKAYFIYGVTAAGVCAQLGLNRFCPYGKNG